MNFTFIKQDRFVIKDSKGNMITRGNCLQAALASMMGLQLRDVPDFSCFFECKNISWSDLMDAWLLSHGYGLVISPQFKQLHGIGLDKSDEAWLGDESIPLETYPIWDKPYEVCGKSPRGDFNHSAIYMNGRLYHDPHPSNDGCEPNSEKWPWTIRRLIKTL